MVDDPKDPVNRVQRISRAYNAAMSGLAKTAALAEKSGSDMVKQDQPRPAPKPPTMDRNGPDRQSYNARLAAEHAKNKLDPQKVAEMAKSLQTDKGNSGKSKEKDHEK